MDSSTACLPLLSEPPPSVLQRGPFNVLYGDLSGPTMEHASAAVCATFNTIVNACFRLRVTILHALATTTFHYIFGQSSGIPTQSCRDHFSLCDQHKFLIPMYIQRANQRSLPNDDQHISLLKPNLILQTQFGKVEFTEHLPPL